MSSQKRFLRSTMILLSGIALLALFPALVQGQTFVLKWGSLGANPGQFNEPWGVAVDAAGNVYVTDHVNERVQKFDSNGVFLTKWGSPGSVPGAFNYPHGIDVDASGNVFVVDMNHRVQQFDSNGTYLSQWGSYGTGDGQFDIPAGLAVDASGFVFVSERNNHRVQKFATVITYTITATAGANGSIVPPGATPVDQGNDQAYTITPDPDYHIADVLVDGGSVGAVSSYTFTDVQDNHTIEASFALNTITVSVPTITATYNEVLTIPVTIDDATGLVAAEIFVEYDTALLTVFSAPDSPASSAGTLTDDWTVETNTEPGAGTMQTLKIAMATDASGVTGPQTLINLKFTVNDVRVPASSPLTLTHVLLNDGDPPNTPIDGSVTLVGTDGTLDSSPAQIVPRQEITVTVVDADLNTAFSTAQTVSVDVASGAQTETLVLTETDVDTGEFTGTIETVFSLSFTSDDDILQVKTGDQIVFTYDDALDAAGAGPNPRTDQTDVVGGTDGTAAISIASQPGDNVYIKVVDPDISTPPLGYMPAANTIDVEVVNSTSLDALTVTLTETAPSSGIFIGTLATLPGVEAGKMTSAEDDLLTVTYIDDLAADGEPQVDRTGDNQVLDPWGDADDNEQLQAYDAALTLLEVLFPTTLDGLEELAANVDEDPVGTGINPYDASLILQHRVGIITSFPVQAATSTNHPQPNPGSPKALPQELALTLRAGEGYVSVWTDEREGIVSGDLLVSGVDGRVAMTDELGEFLVASRPTDDGLRIVFAGAESVSGPGELLRVYGVDPTEARLTRASFNNGDLAGTGTDLQTPERRPLRTALHGNWPNPFNPETTLRFDLAQPGEVKLEVFDLLGQRVTTLVSESLPAGSHQVVWRGVDETGRRVSSGIYLYRLQTGDYTQMRRMLLLK